MSAAQQKSDLREIIHITVDIPDNPGALDELEASLKDGGLADLRKRFSWMACVAESAIEVEVDHVKRHSLNPGRTAD